MLSGLFNYDNPVWRFIGKFWDVLILNVLWLVCSIPIVTIGASTTAMYYVTLKLARDEDGYTIRSFFKSFKENFRQATVIWLIFLAVVFLLGFDLYFFVAGLTEPSTFRTVMTTVFSSPPALLSVQAAKAMHARAATRAKRAAASFFMFFCSKKLEATLGYFVAIHLVW